MSWPEEWEQVQDELWEEIHNEVKGDCVERLYPFKIEGPLYLECLWWEPVYRSHSRAVRAGWEVCRSPDD
jgi:hypothetical protein